MDSPGSFRSLQIRKGSLIPTLVNLDINRNESYTGMHQAGGAGEAYAPPVFGGSVNPISTRGAHYPHPLLPAPPDF